MATATKTLTGFELSCPECGCEVAITLDLNDLDACVCSGCDAEFSPADAVEKLAASLAKWKAVVRWVDLMPEALALTD